MCVCFVWSTPPTGYFVVCALRFVNNKPEWASGALCIQNMHTPEETMELPVPASNTPQAWPEPPLLELTLVTSHVARRKLLQLLGIHSYVALLRPGGGQVPDTFASVQARMAQALVHRSVTICAPPRRVLPYLQYLPLDGASIWVVPWEPTAVWFRTLYGRTSIIVAMPGEGRVVDSSTRETLANFPMVALYILPRELSVRRSLEQASIWRAATGTNPLTIPPRVHLSWAELEFLNDAFAYRQRHGTSDFTVNFPEEKRAAVITLSWLLRDWMRC